MQGAVLSNDHRNQLQVNAGEIHEYDENDDDDDDSLRCPKTNGTFDVSLGRMG